MSLAMWKERSSFLDVRKAPLFDNRGKVHRHRWNGARCYGAKESEKTLQLSYHSLESISEIITVTDLEDRFTYVNQAFLDTYGYTREEIIGKTPSIIWSPSNNPRD
jgi:PAS domain-containing protein